MVHRYPEELKDYAQWVCWRFAKRKQKNGRIKKTKVPFNPQTGEMAQVNEPLSWGTYEEACQAAYQYDGIGFVFTAYDPFIGIDIDHCIDKDDQLSRDAYRLMKKIGSYAEESPSKTGMHIIVTGKLKNGRKGLRRENIEIYQEGRFFTVTGECILYAPIVSGQEVIDEIIDKLDDEERRRKIKQEKKVLTGPDILEVSDEKLLQELFLQSNGMLLRRLFMGEDAKYGDTSRDDLYFCWMINYRNGNDLEQTDRIFRASARMRPKWDTVHFSDGMTYGQRTLKKSMNWR